ncbi:MAG: PKD domain-containing protein [Candidatus Electrothrix sp. AX5]|nr:PKD domain-containing protein [Candidatus Electrothrix sp. AX5]
MSYDGSSSSGAVSYAWEFGDGDMSNESRAEHIFTAVGTYTSTLTVTDRQNNINTKSVIVNVNESSGSALTASFVTDPISLSGTAPFTVSYDGSSSSGAVSYTWEFGDGDVSSGSQTEHIYLTAGIYTSTLTITDSQGNIHTKSVIVTVAEDPAKNTPPTAVIESSATAGTVPLNVSFAGSGSHDPEGSIIAYIWNFGDGSPTASGSTTTHQYTAEGTYNASLKVTDNQGAIDTVSTSIIVTGPQPENQAPTAKITTSTTQGSLPLTVTFDGSASTDPENGSLTYSWNFGDGAFDQGEIVNHTYNMPGSVTATLTVTDSVGAVDSTSTTIKILPVFSFEVGEVEIDNNWVRVKIMENFVNPIVVTGPPSSNDSQPSIIRLKNIDKTGFEIRLQEWDYLDGKHASETVAYLILEQGSFTLKDGTRVEAGLFDSQDNNFHSVSFATAFATEPVIITSIASFNEEDAVTGRIKNISLKSFEHKIQEQESFSNGHSNETVNYVAWEASRVTFGNFNAIVDRTARAVKNKWYTIPYDELLPDLPIFLGTMQSQNEADTAAIRYRNKSTSDIQVKVEEEKSADRDTRHTTESVGYFLFW